MRDNVVEKLFSVFRLFRPSGGACRRSCGRAATARMDLVLAARRARDIRLVAQRLDRGTATNAALALAACVLFTAPAFAGAQQSVCSAVSRFGRELDRAVALLVGWTLWTGASVVTIAPRRGWRPARPSQ